VLLQFLWSVLAFPGPGARIVVTNKATGVSRETTSGGTGGPVSSYTGSNPVGDAKSYQKLVF